MLCPAISPCCTAMWTISCRPGAIARRVNVRHAGLHAAIRHDASAIRGERRCVQAERRNVRHAAEPEKDFLGLRPRTSCRHVRKKLLSSRPVAAHRELRVRCKASMPSRRKTFSMTDVRRRRISCRMCGLRWISVTSTPNRAKNCANSHGHRAAAEHDERFREPGQLERRVAVQIAESSSWGRGEARRWSRWR